MGGSFSTRRSADRLKEPRRRLEDHVAEAAAVGRDVASTREMNGAEWVDLHRQAGFEEGLGAPEKIGRSEASPQVLWKE